MSSKEPNMSNSKNLDKAVPGVVVGTLVGAALSPTLPFVVTASILGGVIAYVTDDDSDG